MPTPQSNKTQLTDLTVSREKMELLNETSILEVKGQVFEHQETRHLLEE